MNALKRWDTSIRYFITGPYFDHQYKGKVHIAQFCLATTLIILTGVRIGVLPSTYPVSRSDTIGIVMGIKTLVILTYQVVTTHSHGCKRWASAKAYCILNCLEVPFWLVVVILTFMGISRYCKAASCALSWIIVLIAAVLEVLALWTAVVSYQYYRYSKKAAIRESQV